MFADTLFPYVLHELAVEKFVQKLPLSFETLTEAMRCEKTKRPEITKKLKVFSH